jgi:diguanylate cyclase (GGDEF)-like protein
VLLTASWGIASYPEDGEDLEELLKIADDRCYIAKKSGKDRYSALQDQAFWFKLHSKEEWEG